MVGGVGQRMLTSVSKRMAAEFFGNVGASLGGQGGAPATTDDAPPAATPGTVFSAPAVRADGIRSQDDFVKGILVGAGLVLLGVVAGSVFGRRR
jgi:hypothetical protein